jgi:hypothetical protein
VIGAMLCLNSLGNSPYARANSHGSAPAAG